MYLSTLALGYCTGILSATRKLETYYSLAKTLFLHDNLSVWEYQPALSPLCPLPRSQCLKGPSEHAAPPVLSLKGNDYFLEYESFNDTKGFY
jgi:hypothetical protein